MKLFGSNKLKVLVIDDDPSLRRQVRLRLEMRENFDVIEAENGETGLVLANSHNPDVIILDWMLPDIQGPEVLDYLKLKNETSSIPVLMLTDKNKIGNVEEAFDLGADAYLTKPLSLQRLGEKVCELLIQPTPQ